MEKPRKRGERRWRSRCVWMRRLKQDWNEHGWKRDPTYDYDWSGGSVVCYLSERTTLCDCFDLTHREALRFKDTPNTSSFRRKDWDKYRTKRLSNVPIQERRAVPVEREYLARRKRAVGRMFRERIRCSCGYFLGFQDTILGDGGRNSLRRYVGPSPRPRCPDCRRKQMLLA